MNMLLWRTPRQTATRIVLGRIRGLVKTATRPLPAAQHRDKAPSDVPEEGRIVKNLVVSPRRAVSGVGKKMTLQPLTLPRDGDQIPLRDGAPQTHGNLVSTRGSRIRSQTRSSA